MTARELIEKLQSEPGWLDKEIELGVYDPQDDDWHFRVLDDVTFYGEQTPEEGWTDRPDYIGLTSKAEDEE